MNLYTNLILVRDMMTSCKRPSVSVPTSDSTSPMDYGDLSIADIELMNTLFPQQPIAEVNDYSWMEILGKDSVRAAVSEHKTPDLIFTPTQNNDQHIFNDSGSLDAVRSYLCRVKGITDRSYHSCAKKSTYTLG